MIVTNAMGGGVGVTAEPAWLVEAQRSVVGESDYMRRLWGQASVMTNAWVQASVMTNGMGGPPRLTAARYTKRLRTGGQGGPGAP